MEREVSSSLRRQPSRHKNSRAVPNGGGSLCADRVSFSALSLCVTILATAPSGAQTSERPLKIGVITDMNGPLSSATGAGSVEAARMAAEEFGWFINGRRIEIVSADHQNKPDVGASIAMRWFDAEQVDVIADMASSSVGLAIVEIARNRNKVLLVSGPGSSGFTGKACAPTSIHWTWDTYRPQPAS